MKMDPIERLLDEIRAIPGPLSRQKIINRRNEIQARKRAKRLNADSHEPAAEAASAGDEPNVSAGEVDTAPRDKTVSAILLTPNHTDAARLAKRYVEGGEPFCLRIGDDATNDTVLMFVMRLSELTMVTANLPTWKAKRFSHIFLFDKPETPDLTDATVVAVCGRATDDLIGALRAWPSESDPTKLCQALLAQLPGRRIHLFAKADTPGWESVVGERNWSTKVGAP
jgi:hypothetical protein